MKHTKAELKAIVAEKKAKKKESYLGVTGKLIDLLKSKGLITTQEAKKLGGHVASRETNSD